ncbi:MAG TPA: hypothetical protein VLD13_02910 [Gaiellaceae bacterium]|nr:hypothetical protein [Gaiellaceae bacterium]
MKRAAIVLILAALGLAGDASGHGRTGRSGYVSTVSALVPPVLGVSVNVLGGDDRLRLSNYSGKTVVVLGYEGEPLLRFDKDAVFRNARSPASGAPLWRRVARTASFDWHDRRIHWPAPEPPQAVRDEPDKAHLIFNWRVPARADGKPFAITGFLGYVPPRSQERGGPGWVLPLAGGVGLAALLVVGAGARRRSRRAR